MPELRVIFVAPDYDATVGFFTGVMGLDLREEFADEGARGCLIRAGDGLIEIFDGAGGPGPVTGVRLAIEVSDADAEHRRLIDAGAEILRAPEVQPWGHKNFDIQGPDGWVITLFEIVAAH